MIFTPSPTPRVKNILEKAEVECCWGDPEGHHGVWTRVGVEEMVRRDWIPHRFFFCFVFCF
jgi:hypothetical protein